MSDRNQVQARVEPARHGQPPMFVSRAAELEARSAERVVNSLGHPRAEQGSGIQRRRRSEPSLDNLPEAVGTTIDSGGEQLSHATNADMRERLGFDFSHVKIHRGRDAAMAAASLDAVALSIGSHVIVPEPAAIGGELAYRAVLAHELWHTTQAEDSSRIGRQRVQGIETDPVTFTRADVERTAAISYWDQIVTSRFVLTTINTVTSRFKADPEERDAVLSVLWTRRPSAPVRTDTEVVASIPVRKSAAGSHAVLYRFRFEPPATPKAKERVSIQLMAEGAQAAVAIAPPAPAGYVPPSFKRDTTGFPGAPEDYWKAHPEEHRSLYRWIEAFPGTTVDQFVTTTETPPKGKRHDSTFHVAGKRDASGKFGILDIDLEDESAPVVDSPVTDYREKAGADVELEKAQAKKSDKLGRILGIDKVPVDEQQSVKYVVLQYFNAKTRNREVDAIVPIAKKQINVHYTFRFRPTTNDVDIERIGVEGASSTLTALGLDIRRVNGFAANSDDPIKFKAWIAKRYPAIKLTGTTVADMQASATKEMVANATSPAWFSINYGMPVLDDVAAESRLKTVHGLSSAEMVGLKSFAPEDLRLLEFALQSMSDPILALLRGTNVARQTTIQEKKNKVISPSPHAGFTHRNGADRTIIMADGARGSEGFLFAGGAAGVRPASAMTYAHELGHVVGWQNRIRTAFNAFVKVKGIKPVTKYASKKPADEAFPEAFALYQLDPEWMQINNPDLFAWFEKVKATGSPP